MIFGLHQYRLWTLFCTLVLAGVLMLVGPLAARVGENHSKRVALVIGNSNYKSVYSLKNAVNDSRSISVVLSRLGFEVIEKSDISRAGFMAALEEFSKAAQDAEAAVFYYSGHGFQLGGSNFLVPTDAQLNNRSNILDETMRLGDVSNAVQDRNRQTLIFLDACRNNPLPASVRDATMSDGLAQLEAGNGTFVAFATQPGNITRDGAGDHSPFAAALIEHMETPGISISDMMIEVRNSVEVATLETQTPWDQSSLRNQFYFLPQEEESAALTDEDKELLLSLNPALRKKFEARFGIRIEAGEETEDGEIEVKITKVKPTLLIQQGQEQVAEIIIDEEKPVKGRFQISQGDTASVEVASLASDKDTVSTKLLEPIDPDTVADQKNNGITLPSFRPVIAPMTDEKPQQVASLDNAEVAPRVAKRIEADTVPEAVVTGSPQKDFKKTEKIEVAKRAAVETAKGKARVVSNAGQATVIVGTPGKLTGQVEGQVSPGEPDAGVVEKTVESSLVASAGQSVPTTNRVESIAPSSNSAGLKPAKVAQDRKIAKAVKARGSTLQRITGTEISSVSTGSERLVGKEVAPTGLRDEPEEDIEVASLDITTQAQTESSDNSKTRITATEEQSITPPSHAIEVQTELVRLGCYRSKVDGLWGPNSARALLRYYGNKKIAPDELEPTASLLASLQNEEVVVCKRTIKKPKKTRVATRNSRTVKKSADRRKGSGKKASKRKTKKRIKRSARKKALKKGLSSGVFR